MSIVSRRLTRSIEAAPSVIIALTMLLIACTTASVAEAVSNDTASETASAEAPDCVAGEGPFAAVDITDYGGFCLGSEQDIFYAAPAAAIAQPYAAPTLTATFWKCDETYSGEDKECQIRVGSFEGEYDASLIRESFTWERYALSAEITWELWPDPASWTEAPEGDEKTFFLVCAEDDLGGSWNQWRAEQAVAVTKRCP